MAGTTKAFVTQGFPRDLDAKEWIHVMPDLSVWIMYVKYVNATVSLPAADEA
jgi:hypothetical protein